MRAAAALALVIVLLTAGCLTGRPAEEADPSQDIEATADPNDDQGAGSAGETDRSADPLANPPSWIPGEYWTIEVDSTLLDEPVQWTRVVAGFTADTYLVGQPADEASAAGLLLHVPGLGDVAQNNLSYSVHGTTFTPVEFPLEDGDTWQTTFEGDPVNATARIQDGKAHVEYCCTRNISATYDPEVRAVSQMTVDEGFLSYEVLDHGYVYEGEIEIPRDREVVFLEGRMAGATTAAGSVGPPTGQAEVPSAIDRVAFTQIVGNLDLGPTPETGVYVERAELPGGSAYATSQAAQTEGLAVSFHEAANASGTWSFEHVAAGPGMAFTEGIGYQLETRTLD